MKGNQESMLYTTNATVAALNHVSGFDPLKFLRRTTSRKTCLLYTSPKGKFALMAPTGRASRRMAESTGVDEARTLHLSLIHI